MKNQREIYKALLAGETLDNGDFTCRMGVTGSLLDDEGDKLSLTFTNPEFWQIYKEPKWYENIPDGGVLCWVTDKEYPSRAERGNVQLISNFFKDGFMTRGKSCGYAIPLTKQEIQVFMDNVPEIK